MGVLVVYCLVFSMVNRKFIFKKVSRFFGNYFFLFLVYFILNNDVII